MKHLLHLLLVSIVVVACEDAFHSHPYDMNFDGQRNINEENIRRIESECRDKDTLSIAFVSDTHGWYSDAKDMAECLNRIGVLDFVVHLGDLTDCGTTKEYVWSRDVMGKIRVPYVALVGNHDFLGTGDQMFRKMYGNYDFSFIAGRVKFVCLNTNATEYDHLAAVPNLDFMESEISADSALFDRTVVCMHARPYCEQFNNNVAKVFHHYVKSFPGLMFCMNGHDHRLCQEDIYGDGMVYYGVDSAEHRSFYLFTITQHGYEYEIVRY